MRLQSSIGIFLQENRISMAYVVRDLKGLRLASYETHDLEKDLDPEKRIERWGNEISSFIEKNHISSADIFISIPRPQILVRFISLPISVKSGLRSAIQYELEKFIPFTVDEIYFDCETVSEDKENKKLTAFVAAGPKDEIAPYLDLVTRFGLEVSGIEPSSTSILCFCLDQGEIPKYGKGVVLWSDREYVELDMVDSGRLMDSKYFPVPDTREVWTELISTQLDSFRKGLESEDEEIFLLICSDLIGSSDLEQLGEGLPPYVRFQSLNPTNRLPAAVIPAYGSALRLCKMPVSHMNLLPDHMRKKPSRAPLYTLLALSAILVISVVIWAGSVVVHKNIYLKELDDEIARLAPQVKEVEKMEERCTLLKKRLSFLKDLSGKRMLVLDVLKELSLRIPETAWIDRFVFTDHKVEIKGKAESASGLIPRLEASPLFSDVSFLSSILKRRDGKEEFRIGLTVVNPTDKGMKK